MPQYIGGGLLNRTQSRARRLGRPVRQRYTRDQAQRLKSRLKKQAVVRPTPYKPRADQLTNNTTGPKPGLGPQPTTTPKSPVGQHATPDSQYYNDVDTAKRKEQSSLGQLDDAQQGIEHEYGFTDPTNPFSRVNSMKQAFLARRKSASVALASEGKLYSGTHERAIARTRSEEEAARAELRAAYEAAIRQIGASKAGVKFASEEERNQAFEDYLARAPEADVALDSGGTSQRPTSGPASNPDARVSLGTDASGPATRSDVAAPGEPSAIQKMVSQAPRRRGGRRGPVAPGEPQSIQNTIRIRQLRRALMSHGKNWGQRHRLLAELKRLRG